jgi:hypothetical protein
VEPVECAARLRLYAQLTAASQVAGDNAGLTARASVAISVARPS